MDCPGVYARFVPTVNVPELPNVKESADVVKYLSPEIPEEPLEPEVPS